MALKYYTGDKITGLSTDTKPTTIGDGATFYETDTKKIYLKVSGSWVEVNYQTALGFTPENSANKLTAFQGTPDNTHYPSEKLVKDSLDGKMTNPMTASGDIIYGGNNGTPTRLAKGTDGQILTLVSGVPAWAAGGGTMIYPGAGIAVSTGTGWGTSLTAPSGAIVGTTDVQELTNKTLTSALIKTGLTPDTNDGAALGSASKMFSDLFLASGAVINFNNGDTTLTHSANTLTLAGGKLTLGRDFDLTNTTHANQYGIITKNGYPFIHDFNYGNNGTVTTEGNNIFIGLYAGNFTMGSTAEYSSQASRNSAVGYASLNKNTTGTGNSAVGYISLAANTTGAGNSAVGTGSLCANTTGSNNTAIGYASLAANTTGAGNSAVGYASLNKNTTGAGNSAVGTGSLCANTTGSNNTAIGSDSLHGATGSYNSALGDSAAYYIADGSTVKLSGDYGLYLGASTKASADGTNNEIVIGYNAIGAGSNKAVIGNSSVTDVYLGSSSGASKLWASALNLSGLTASKVAFTDANKNLTSTGIGTSSQFIKGDGSLDSNTYMVNPIAASPSADTISGISITLTAAANVALGDACYIDSNGKAAIAKADAIAHASVIALAGATISANNSGTFLLHGVVHCHTLNPGWTTGGLVYLSTTGTTGNTLTQTAPSSTDNVIQILGVALAADILYFNPQLVQVEHT